MSILVCCIFVSKYISIYSDKQHIFLGCMSPAFVAMKAIDSNRNLMAAAAASAVPPFPFGALHNSSTNQTTPACSSSSSSASSNGPSSNEMDMLRLRGLAAQGRYLYNYIFNIFKISQTQVPYASFSLISGPSKEMISK